MGRIFEPLECWKNSRENRPTIPITLYTIDGRTAIKREFMPVDTGFAGAMLLTRESFSYFETAELPESESRIYRTLLGPVPMRTARAIIRLPQDEEIEILVDSPVYGLGKSLVGLQVINKFELLLNGPKSETCVVSERQDRH